MVLESYGNNAETSTKSNQQFNDLLKEVDIVKVESHTKSSCIILSSFLLPLNYAKVQKLSGALDNVSEATELII